MKRSPMNPRRQAMKRDRPPTRKHRNTPGKKRRKPKPDSEFWSMQRAVIYHRSGGRCERHGGDLNATGMEAHHRKLRSQGGEHGVDNLLALCPDCHREVHAHPTASREHGWIVPSGAEPGVRGVLLWDGRTVQLTPEGTYQVIFNHQEETG